MQLSHIPFHKRELIRTRAVTGIILRGKRIQLPCRTRKSIVRSHFGIVESSDQNIGHKPSGNVHDAFVGTSADQHSFTVFADQQILFVTEIVGNKAVTHPFGQSETSETVPAFLFITGKQRKVPVDPVFLRRTDKAGIFFKRCIKSDVFFRSVVMRQERIAMDVHGSMTVEFQKLSKSSAVIVVSVGQHGNIHHREVNTKPFRIFGKQPALPHVKQNPMPSGFNVQRKTVLRLHIRTIRCIFKQGCDFHIVSLSVIRYIVFILNQLYHVFNSTSIPTQIFSEFRYLHFRFISVIIIKTHRPYYTGIRVYKENHRMIKNIVFDMGNVLLRYDPVYYLRNYPENDREILNREIYGSPDWLALDRGEYTEEELIRRIRERLPEHLADEAEKLVKWYRLTTRIDGMEELVRDLHARGWPLYLLSNTSLAFHRFRTDLRALQYFTGEFISADCGILKPDERIYRLFCGQFGLRPEECLFIDDSQANIDSAVRVGFHGIVFDGDTDLLRRQLAEKGITTG